MTPDRFEDHASADTIPADLVQLYAPYQRKTFVGPRVQSLTACGESAIGCVRANCVDRYSNELHVSLLEEDSYERHELVHRMNLFDLHHKYADVMHVEEVVSHLTSLQPNRMAAE